MSTVNEHIGQLKRRQMELICLIQDVVCLSIWENFHRVFHSFDCFRNEMLKVFELLKKNDGEKHEMPCIWCKWNSMNNWRSNWMLWMVMREENWYRIDTFSFHFRYRTTCSIYLWNRINRTCSTRNWTSCVDQWQSRSNRKTTRSSEFNSNNLS